MKKLVICLMKGLLNFTYFFMKLAPTDKNKVVFLSRQSDGLTLDFGMVQNRLKEKFPDAKIVTICNRLEGEKTGIGKLCSFGWATLRSMWHTATASVCVLDAYWPTVSILRHKKSLTVIQMWHALGKIKKSGYQTLGKESGRGREMAELMKMHRGYDYIIAGGKAWNPYYCASFDTTEDKLVNCGLPRIDYLLESKDENRRKVLQSYPQLEDSTVVLYAPTFRRNIELHWEELVESLTEDNSENTIGEPGTSATDCRGNREGATENNAHSKAPISPISLIVKGHPNQNLKITDAMRGKGVYDCPEFKAVDLLSIADYLITDYSAIAIEGSILNVPTYYYLYDYEEYGKKNGMNIDLFQEMEGCAFKEAKELSQVIKKQGDNTNRNAETLRRYREKYLPENLGTSTEKITDLIIEHMRK